MWEEKKNVREDLAKGVGIVQLFFPPDMLDGEWKAYNNNFDLRQYFIIPPRFYYSGGTFYFNNAYRYVKRPIKVYHRGVQQSEPIWVMEEGSPPVCPLKTDRGTKLPYLEVPDLGQYMFHYERAYFIPINGDS